jgi:hypothetical protein
MLLDVAPAVGVCQTCGIGVCQRHGVKEIAPAAPLRCVSCATSRASSHDLGVPAATARGRHRSMARV